VSIQKKSLISTLKSAKKANVVKDDVTIMGVTKNAAHKSAAIRNSAQKSAAHKSAAVRNSAQKSAAQKSAAHKSAAYKSAAVRN
jgi:hypothetical protein